jgi:hypothetical protein
VVKYEGYYNGYKDYNTKSYGTSPMLAKYYKPGSGQTVFKENRPYGKY